MSRARVRVSLGDVVQKAESEVEQEIRDAFRALDPDNPNAVAIARRAVGRLRNSSSKVNVNGSVRG